MLIPAGVLLAGILLRLWAKSDRPFQSTMRGVLRSEILLTVVHLAGLLACVPIPLSPATVLWSAFAGIPGIAVLVGSGILLK